MKLEKDIIEYKSGSISNLHNERDFYKSLELVNAIENAAIAKMRNGKMASHQWRVGKNKCEEGQAKLLAKEIEIKKCKIFEELFEITEGVKKSTKGLGDLWSYDTALRIGISLGIYPTEVYIQAGVKNGLKKLFPEKTPKGRSLPLSIFPKELQILAPYEIENFLCIWGKSKNNKPC
jgi:hypothetical protein